MIAGNDNELSTRERKDASSLSLAASTDRLPIGRPPDNRKLQ
ncbi:hypothetical protein [Sporisorium scitamineum]|uniref:Uncharacterized protein n=1 Tax=Sporisorium scitamineum TaxID=49012 RepID=A0A0F7SBZ5_9BASI|nr:hypothetical protein [Sporisorium scitamineum]